MKADPFAKYYSGLLTPEERFRLMLAAAARGDEAERERQANASGQMTLSVLDHWPYAQAFNELSLHYFIETLEGAALYFDAWSCCDDARDDFGSDETAEDREEKDENAVEQEPGAEGSERETDERLLQSLDRVLALGYEFRTQADGWKLFCERLNIPPFLLWEDLTGFDRIQDALALIAGTDSLPGPAFTSKGYLRYLNRVIRPPGAPELAVCPLTVEGVADGIEKYFRERVKFWGG